MSHVHYDIDPTGVVAPGHVRQPPAPGSEVAGPALTELVYELRQYTRGMMELLSRAKTEARIRYITGRAVGQSDANGDAVIMLEQVPQGATGHLVWCAIDLAGVTPAAPMTAATLWHAIYAASSASRNPVAVGALLDCSPNDPAVDAQLPHVYSYGDPYTSPTLVGPEAFYVVVDATTAARQIGVRYGLLIEQPEP